MPNLMQELGHYPKVHVVPYYLHLTALPGLISHELTSSTWSPGADSHLTGAAP